MMDRMRDATGRLWIAIAAEPNRDAFANFNLLAAGWPTFWPHYNSPITRHGRQSTALRSLFPGYIFAAIEDESDASRICGPDGAHGIRGVADIVRAGDRPGYIDPVILEVWRGKAINGSGLMEPPEQANGHHGPSYAVGQRVRIAHGHRAAGLLAEILRVTGDVVTVQTLAEGFFGRRNKISLDVAQLEGVDAQ